MASTIKVLKIADIIPTKDNPRQVNTKNSEFAELVSSIKGMGVKIPIHVRQHPSKKGKYDLRAGERRLLAAQAAGLTEITAIDHGVINDNEAFDITFAENFARSDLTPLEEGKAVKILLIKYKDDVQAVASKLDRSTRWVLQRKAIHHNLTAASKTFLQENDYAELWTTSHLQLIATLPGHIQDEMIENYEYEGPPTVARLTKEIDDMMRVINKAVFKDDDKSLLPEVPNCCDCTKSTAAQPGLFDDTIDVTQSRKNNRCMDEKCWDLKTDSWLKRTIAIYRKAHKNLLLIVKTKDFMPSYKQAELKEKFGGFVKVEKTKPAKQDAPGAVPAVIIQGEPLGSFSWIKNPIGAGEDQPEAKSVGIPKTLKQKKDELKRKRWHSVLLQIHDAINKSTYDQITHKDKAVAIMTLVVEFGCQRSGDNRTQDQWQLAINTMTKIDSPQAEYMLKHIWGALKIKLRDDIRWNFPISQVSDDYIKKAKAACQLLGLDEKAMWKKACEEYKVPKAWAKQEQQEKAPKKTKKAG